MYYFKSNFIISLFYHFCILLYMMYIDIYLFDYLYFKLHVNKISLIYSLEFNSNNDKIKIFGSVLKCKKLSSSFPKIKSNCVDLITDQLEISMSYKTILVLIIKYNR